MKKNRQQRSKRNRVGRRTFGNGVNTVGNMSKLVSDGVFRLRDTLTLSSGSGGDIKQIISRSYTQFAEEKYLTGLFTEVRLLGFEVSISPAQIYAKSDSDETLLSFGWMAIGTTPATTTTPPSSGDQILAQSDSRELFLRNRVSPFHFKSAILRGGYKLTPFASETSYTFAGCPGSIYVGNMLASSEAASTDLMYVIITGIYQFSGRTT